MVVTRRGGHAGDMTKKTRTHTTALDGLYDGLRRPGIMRSSDDKWFAGVSGGISRRLGIDPLVVRAAFILLAVFFGMGVSLYLVLWSLMPTERGEISLERALKDGDGGSILLLVITAMSVFGGGPWFSNGGFQGVRIGGVAVAGVLAWYFLTRTDRGRDLVASSPWGNRPGERPGAASRAGGWPGASGSEGVGYPPVLSQGNAAAAAGAAANGVQTASAPAPTPDRVRVRVRVRTMGFTLTLVVLGAALAVGALLDSLAQTHDWAGNHLAVGVAGGLAVIGLSLVIGGVAGRRSGVLNPVAGFAIALLAFTSVLPAGIDRPWQVGDRSVTVTTLSTTNDYQLGVGQLTLDLTRAGYAATPTPDVVTASLGVGELDVKLPPNTSVVVNVKGGLGEAAVWTSEGAASHRKGTGKDPQSGANWSHQYTFGTGPVELTVDAQVGLGEIRVITDSTS